MRVASIREYNKPLVLEDVHPLAVRRSAASKWRVWTNRPQKDASQSSGRRSDNWLLETVVKILRSRRR